MNLSMTTIENVFIVEIKFQIITFSYSFSHIKLKLFIYSCIHLVDQLTSIGFITSSASTRTLFEYIDYNYFFITPCFK